jgi:hypothetical protein
MEEAQMKTLDTQLDSKDPAEVAAALRQLMTVPGSGEAVCSLPRGDTPKANAWRYAAFVH